MDGKTPRGIAYSITNSRHTGKNSSLRDFNNRRSAVVRVTENIAKTQNLTTSSSMGNKFMCQSPSRLFPASIDHQKPLPSEVNKSFPQKRPIVKRFIGTVKSNVSKGTRKQLEDSDTKATPKTTGFHEMPYFLDSTDSATHPQLIKDRKLIRHKKGCGSLHAPTISFTQRLIASRDAKKATKSCSQGVRGETKDCNLKNNSSSISKIIPSVYSQSISVPNRKDITAMTRNSLSSSNRKLSGSLKTRLSTSNTPNDSRMINKSKINDHLGMLKPQGNFNRGITREHQAIGNSSHSPSESVVASVCSSRSVDSDSFSRRKNFSKHDASGQPTSSPEQGRMVGLYDYSTNTARAAQHVLESIFFFGSRNYHDQHREMRMDIDNMSYEELLELQEKIGSVSTGLTDEVLTKCLKTSNFKLAPSPSWTIDFVEVASRCSICQEECHDGQGIGTLACEHWYHVICIQQWLRQKNWCPICKAPAGVDRRLMAV